MFKLRHWFTTLAQTSPPTRKTTRHIKWQLAAGTASLLLAHYLVKMLPLGRNITWWPCRYEWDNQEMLRSLVTLGTMYELTTLPKYSGGTISQGIHDRAYLNQRSPNQGCPRPKPRVQPPQATGRCISTLDKNCTENTFKSSSLMVT